MSEQEKAVTLKRIYIVETTDTVSLVRAVSQSQALNHVVKGQYQVRSATADEVATYMEQGATVDNAGEQSAEEVKPAK